jgi:hypothetical protein
LRKKPENKISSQKNGGQNTIFLFCNTIFDGDLGILLQFIKAKRLMYLINPPGPILRWFLGKILSK